MLATPWPASALPWRCSRRHRRVRHPPAKGIAAPGAGDASLTSKLDQSYPYVLVRRTVAIIGGSGDVQISAAMLAGMPQLCLDRASLPGILAPE